GKDRRGRVPAGGQAARAPAGAGTRGGPEADGSGARREPVLQRHPRQHHRRAVGRMSVEVGKPAPDFTLPAVEGGGGARSDFVGKKNVVLFFYPKDMTPGCTVEACTFRDAYEDFVAAGAEVIGISADSVESHQKFASKHGLPMQLLTDADGQVRARYGIKKTL